MRLYRGFIEAAKRARVLVRARVIEISMYFAVTRPTDLWRSLYACADDFSSKPLEEKISSI